MRVRSTAATASVRWTPAGRPTTDALRPGHRYRRLAGSVGVEGAREVGVDGARSRPRTWPSNGFLGRLPEETRQVLLGRGSPVRFEPGERLLAEGATSSHVVLLTGGLVKVTSLAETFEALLAVRTAGDIVGETAALAEHPRRMATVTACGVVTGRLLTAEAFRHVLARHPEAARLVTTIVAERLRWANRRRTDFLAYPAEVRLARALIEIADRYGTRAGDDGVDIVVSLSQPELATLVGVAPATVHKALRALREAGVLRWGYRQITIADPTALARVAQHAGPTTGDEPAT